MKKQKGNKRQATDDPKDRPKRTRASKSRDGWKPAFQDMAYHGDDALLDDVPPSLSDWDEREWEWS